MINSVQFKQIAIYIFLAAEVCCIVYCSVFGPQGMPMIMRLHYENQCIEREVNAFREEIVAAEQHLQDLQRYPYFKEKFIREYLHMARQDDIVYYVP